MSINHVTKMITIERDDHSSTPSEFSFYSMKPKNLRKLTHTRVKRLNSPVLAFKDEGNRYRYRSPRWSPS